MTGKCKFREHCNCINLPGSILYKFPLQICCAMSIVFTFSFVMWTKGTNHTAQLYNCTRLSIVIIYLLYLNYYWSTSFVFLFVRTFEIHYTEICQKDIMLPTLKKRRAYWFRLLDDPSLVRPSVRSIKS